MNEDTMILPTPPGGLRSWRRRLVPDEAARPVQEVRGPYGTALIYGAVPLKVVWHDNERLAAFAPGSRRHCMIARRRASGERGAKGGCKRYSCGPRKGRQESDHGEGGGCGCIHP